MKTGPIATHRIELRIRQLDQLFNSMDPTPFLNRDLDPEAEAFICCDTDAQALRSASASWQCA
jgi:hypothetical protein